MSSETYRFLVTCLKIYEFLPIQTTNLYNLYPLKEYPLQQEKQRRKARMQCQVAVWWCECLRCWLGGWHWNRASVVQGYSGGGWKKESSNSGEAVRTENKYQTMGAMSTPSGENEQLKPFGFWRALFPILPKVCIAAKCYQPKSNERVRMQKVSRKR